MHLVLVHEEEIELLMIVPLVELAELIAHEAEFLAGMRHHIAEEGSYACKLLFVIAGHLVDE